MQRIVLLTLLLCSPLELNAMERDDILHIETITRFNKVPKKTIGDPEECCSIAVLSLKKCVVSLEAMEPCVLNYGCVHSPHPSVYATIPALQTVSPDIVTLECTTTRSDGSTQTQVWPTTIPVIRKFTETKKLDLLDDTEEKVSVTITSTIIKKYKE